MTKELEQLDGSLAALSSSIDGADGAVDRLIAERDCYKAALGDCVSMLESFIGTTADEEGAVKQQVADARFALGL